MTRQQDSGNVGGGGAAWCGSMQQAHLKAVAHTIVSIAGLFISSVRHVLLSEMFLPVVAGSICGRQAGRQAGRHAGMQAFIPRASWYCAHTDGFSVLCAACWCRLLLEQQQLIGR